jgi:oligopeptide/dipeptide ABC transporter ATP-binding protein
VRGRPASHCRSGGAHLSTLPLLRIRGLQTYFPVRRGILQRTAGYVHAVDGVDLDIAPGETVGLVGESGCGKTTLGRTVLGLVPSTGGEIWFQGQQLQNSGRSRTKRVHRDMQIIFQDPFSSLDPRMRVGHAVGEGLAIHGIGDRRQRAKVVADTLARVGLGPEAADHFPHEFSGGQRQRIGIARALIVQPSFVVADEPVSALDVSVQSQVLNLLVELKKEFNLTYLFVAHNLAVVGYISDRIAVMYLGKIVELGPARELFHHPQHPYTMALLSAIPQPVPGQTDDRIILSGDVPNPVNPPSGCRFRTRCPIAQPICADVEPPLSAKREGHLAACHFAGTPIRT